MAVKGADNLYTYDSDTGVTSFIADLCSGPALSGIAEDVRCPADLESGSAVQRSDADLWSVGAIQHEAQVAGPESDPGRFLVFSTYGQLISHGPQADADDAKDVYRYDAVTGELNRVSLGEAGGAANGNCDEGKSGTECDATIFSKVAFVASSVHAENGLDTRAVSNDGSRIVFETAQPLSTSASNGLLNIYEWHQEVGGSGGSVSLVSSGSASEPEEDVVMSEDGDNIFFVTSQGLLPQDGDGQADVYDARFGVGFGQEPVEVEQCGGDACQGPLTTPAPLLVPGSVPQAPGGNFPPPKVTAKKPVTKKPVKKLEKAKAKKRNTRKKAKKAGRPRRLSRSGKVGR
jgi:hypothetical protein